jgi:hypothetical protein
LEEERHLGSQMYSSLPSSGWPDYAKFRLLGV